MLGLPRFEMLSATIGKPSDITIQYEAVRYEDKRVQNQPIVDTSYRQSIMVIISVFRSSDESASVRGENTVICDRPDLDKYWVLLSLFHVLIVVITHHLLTTVINRVGVNGSTSSEDNVIGLSLCPVKYVAPSLSIWKYVAVRGSGSLGVMAVGVVVAVAPVV